MNNEEEDFDFSGMTARELLEKLQTLSEDKLDMKVCYSYEGYFQPIYEVQTGFVFDEDDFGSLIHDEDREEVLKEAKEDDLYERPEEITDCVILD